MLDRQSEGGRCLESNAAQSLQFGQPIEQRLSRVRETLGHFIKRLQDDFVSTTALDDKGIVFGLDVKAAIIRLGFQHEKRTGSTCHSEMTGVSDRNSLSCRSQILQLSNRHLTVNARGQVRLGNAIERNTHLPVVFASPHMQRDFRAGLQPAPTHDQQPLIRIDIARAAGD